MDIGIVLLVILLLMVFGGLPRWCYHRFGYAPSGLLGTVFVIVLVLVLLGQFPSF